jgi:membrane protein
VTEGARDIAPVAAGEASGGVEPAARLKRTLEVVGRAVHGIRADRVQVRAMALTYISLFALVPALVVAFSVVQAFTGMERISAEVHEFLLANLAVGARTSIEPYLDRFINNTHATRAGLVGGAFLLWSAFSLLSNVERAINDLWEVPRRRSLRMQALIYWMGLTFGPLVLAASATATQLAQQLLASVGAKTVALLAGCILSSALLTVMYLVVPTVRVRFRCALTGGVAAGIAWELAKWLFALFVAKFVHYSAIYGSVAAIPIFLTWIYLSWLIVLFGARLAFVVQNAPSVMSRDAESHGRAARELLAGRTLVLVARAFQAGSPAPGPEQVARSLRAGMGALEVIEALRAAGLVRVLAGGGLVPARAPETISLLDVRRALTRGEVARESRLDPVGSVFRQADERAEERLRVTTIRSLLEEQPGGEPASALPVSDPSGARRGLPDAPES